ncbi:MAG: hypothetical protein Edafosvirus1_122 [Edafosvirus sp.]|uniref:Uncharacterized protein n=1 Tax=Edafosvirus sp. TaxID=2487765 RepID=A0A3G4ZUW7_9VIRU|nr:MAG: hypothetical protein Edafosvirus1_122 [Edafosvirus sp.]
MDVDHHDIPLYEAILSIFTYINSANSTFRNGYDTGFSDYRMYGKPNVKVSCLKYLSGYILGYEHSQFLHTKLRPVDCAKYSHEPSSVYHVGFLDGLNEGFFDHGDSEKYESDITDPEYRNGYATGCSDGLFFKMK